MEWQPVISAPFDRDLELAVIEDGEVHSLVFACRRVMGGWLRSNAGARLFIDPTHWRDWQPLPSEPLPASRAKEARLSR